MDSDEKNPSLWSISKRFEINPVPWSRPRANATGGRKPVLFNSGDLRRFQSAIGLMARVGIPRKLIPVMGPIRMDITFLLRRPKTVKRLIPDCKPDLSNLIKAIEDALNGVWYGDDAQIVEIVARKIYTEKPVISGAIDVTISPVLSETKEQKNEHRKSDQQGNRDQGTDQYDVGAASRAYNQKTIH